MFNNFLPKIMSFVR